MFETNEYFDGKVKSIAFQTETLPATVGVMAAGEYVFNTAKKEKMVVVSGALTVKLPNQSSEVTYLAGESFEVAADSAFDVKVSTDTAYLCLYS
ncbi:MAG: pyrimidine/purine nucleoside phosphorylase [Gammaproteobacteria bacterium]|nr:pyrimidine/purine nucleoside phosphorylase [Gammaproteobacteria bacterium]